MKRFAEREVLVLTAVTTVLVGVLTLLTTHGDWATTLLTVPLVASISFWSLLFARRIGARWAPKPSEPTERLVPTPTSERPEHAQRRRQRRVPRGRRGPGEG